MSARKIVRKLGIPLALVTAGFAVCFLALELGLRALGFDRMGGIAEGRGLILRESDFPQRMYELAPDASGFAWRTQVATNSFGLRDRELPVERTGAPRVTVLGDSITFGSGVAVKDRFTEQLEGLLRERLGGPVEVMNLGVGGYDTLQEVATLEDVGLRFDPDVVVLAYCVNDLADNSPNLEYIHSLEHAGSVLYRLRSAQLLRIALDRLELMRRLRRDNQNERFAERFRDQIAPVRADRELTALRDELEARLAEEENPDMWLDWYRSDAHLGKVEFALGRLRDLAEQHGFAVIVGIIPYLGESASYDVVYRMVRHLCFRHGFEAVNLAPHLASGADAGLEGLRLWAEDAIHPNERGHRLIAQALLPAVAARLRGRPAPHGPDTAGAALPTAVGGLP